MQETAVARDWGEERKGLTCLVASRLRIASSQHFTLPCAHFFLYAAKDDDSGMIREAAKKLTTVSVSVTGALGPGKGKVHSGEEAPLFPCRKYYSCVGRSPATSTATTGG